MQIKNGLVPKYFRISRIADISRTARLRLDWFDFYRGHSNNAALTCRHFAISRKTFYKWKRLYDFKYLGSLEDRSRRPQHTRQPTWSRELAQAVLELREEHPRWGKEKLALLCTSKALMFRPLWWATFLKALRQAIS